MDEFTGNKYPSEPDEKCHYTSEYVEWLEEQVKALKSKLAQKDETIGRLHSQLEQATVNVSRLARRIDTSDVVPLPDYDEYR